MKFSMLSFIAAATALSMQGQLVFASNDLQSCEASDISQRIKALSSSSPAAKWPRDGMNNDEFLKLPLEERLNQLVLDDNLRTLHMSVHSDFARNTPSFKRIESLVQVLANRNLPAKSRWEASQALGENKHVVAVYGLPSLIQAFHGDPDITVRHYAALALVKIDLRSAVPQLIYGLDDSNPDIRQISAAALHSAGAAAVPYLVKLVKCDDPHMKKLGCMGLAEVGAPAGNAVSVLRGAETENDASGAFSRSAAVSIDKIRAEKAALETASTEIAFESTQWLREENSSSRPGMAKHLLSTGLLNGKTSKEVTALLGRGVSVDNGRQLRYSVGPVPSTYLAAVRSGKKKHSSTTAAKNAQADDAWLVLSIKNGLVSDCELKAFDATEWNVGGEDHLVAQGF